MGPPGQAGGRQVEGQARSEQLGGGDDGVFSIFRRTNEPRLPVVSERFQPRGSPACARRCRESAARRTRRPSAGRSRSGRRSRPATCAAPRNAGNRHRRCTTIHRSRTRRTAHIYSDCETRPLGCFRRGHQQSTPRHVADNSPVRQNRGSRGLAGSEAADESSA